MLPFVIQHPPNLSLRCCCSALRKLISNLNKCLNKNERPRKAQNMDRCLMTVIIKSYSVRFKLIKNKFSLSDTFSGIDGVCKEYKQVHYEETNDSLRQKKGLFLRITSCNVLMKVCFIVPGNTF